MMVNRLRNVMDAIEKLPANQQEQIAQQLEAIVEEHEWDTFIAGEQGAQLVADIIANHEREKQAGTIVDGDW